MTAETTGKKVALITGGARGIGLGIARELANSGWSLMLNGIRPKSDVAEVLNEFAAQGVEVDYCAANIGSAPDRTKLIEKVAACFGQLDCLVNNAGITSPGRKDILEADEESWDTVFDINLKGPFFLTQLAAQLMTTADTQPTAIRRSVIFISSISAEFVSVNRGDYCITKHGLGMATKLWAVRLAEFGIDVFEVRPGVIRSDMTSAVTEKYDRLIEEGLTHERRWGDPSDVGQAVRTLAEHQLPYATGQVIKVDGGMTIQEL